jgi:hypothetical protein
MTVLGYFYAGDNGQCRVCNLGGGGYCSACNQPFAFDEEQAALMHFATDHNWECLESGPESHFSGNRILHFTVYRYGAK